NRNAYPLILTLLSLFLSWASTALVAYKIYVIPFEPPQYHATVDLGISVFSVSQLVLWVTALFLTRKTLLHYYNVVEPIKLKLSFILTFLLSTLYLQYHLSRIARWKKTGVIP
ncbi:MAG TPA: hypothetical protein VK970_16905, partial [Candidatus Methylacidiphilales bacterium]|nr:hypothetical protein [Candidatus Methylacidiphilales bacterium]